MFLFSFLGLPVIYISFYVLVQSTTGRQTTSYVPNEKFNIQEFYKQNKTSILILVFSIITFVIFSGIIALFCFYGYLDPNLYLLIDVIFLCLLFIIGPVSFYIHIKDKEKDEMQERFPEFLIEVGDSLSSGMNAFEAIKVAEKGRYGKLSPEIKMMKTQLSWNIPIKHILLILLIG